MNLLSSIPPNVISPLVEDSELVGANEIPTSWASRIPWLNALSVTVEMHDPTLGNKVPTRQSQYDRWSIHYGYVPHVRSVGPILERTLIE